MDKAAVEEFNLTVYTLHHAESGALAYHIARADKDHAFCVAFRTPVTNSNGVAHILEHTVLCGSQRYPVRDPFFMLVRRSLKTFMNAMTAQDYTMYPFSTQNEQDFQNLLEVYLDACFFPLLNPMDFKQEGHRLEVAPTTDSQGSTSPGLQLKGVVYNEMKGAMSDTSQLFLARLQEHLFPTNSNHWNSGGEPAVIPTLTQEFLKKFHAQCYNVENAVFISYGDGEPPLATINERVLQPVLKHRAANNSQGKNIPPPYQPEVRFAEPKTVHSTFPPDPLVPDPSRQTKASMAWVSPPLNSLSEHEREVELFGLQMMSSLLLDSATSPMYQLLIDANIGSGYAPGTGVDTSTIEPTFSVGLQGVSDDDVPRVLEIIEQTLQQVAKDGFPADRIEASIHQIELNLKHIRSHFGIGLLMRMIPSWAHRTNPIAPLQVNALIEKVREKLKQGPFFQDLIQRHLLSNPHRVTLIMRPDAAYAQKELHAEQRKLAQLEDAMTEQEKQKLKEEAKELVRIQESKQDTKGCQLPSLSVSNIKTKAEEIHLEKVEFTATLASNAAKGGLSAPRILSLPQPTNGVGYFRSLLPAALVPLRLRPFLPLYTSLLTEVGAGERGYREMAAELEMYTGGVSAELQVFSHLSNLSAHSEYVLIKSLALERNVGRMMELLGEVLREPRWDNPERLHQLLMQSASSSAASLQDSGSAYAVSDASQHLFPALAAGELYSGVKHVQHVNGIVKSLSHAGSPAAASRVLDSVICSLQEISRILVRDGGLERNFIVGDERSLREMKKELPTLMQKLPAPSQRSSPISFPFVAPSQSIKTFYALPLQVNNVALVLPTVPYTHEDAPKLDVMAKILSSIYVHREVREKGGAYGGSVSHSSDGVLAFSSYRDPNTLKTLDAYHSAPKWMLQGDHFTSTDIEEALLSLFSSIDSPKSPASKGLGQFLYEITNAQRQEYRDRLLAVDKEQVMDVCRRYLSPERLAGGHVTIVGDEAAVPDSMRSGTEWKVQSLELAQQAEASEGVEA